MIDQSVYASGIFTPTPSILTATVSAVSSYIAYDSPATYTLSITPTKKIPQNSIVTIQFPPEITLIGITVPSCTYTISGTTTTSTSIQTMTAVPTLIKITDAFLNAAYSTPLTPFLIQCTGFQNPRTTAVTGTFKIYTYDPLNFAMESGTSGITV